MRPDKLLKLLVSAERLNKALNTPGDLQILMKYMKVIPRLDDFSVWLKDSEKSKEIKEFKSAIKYLKDESTFLKNKNSSKHKIVDKHIESMEKGQAFMFYTFYCLLNEIWDHEENIARNVLLKENSILRNLLSAHNIHFNEVDISYDTARFINENRSDYASIDRNVINDTEEWLNEYKRIKKEIPKDVKQLRNFIKESRKNDIPSRK